MNNSAAEEVNHNKWVEYNDTILKTIVLKTADADSIERSRSTAKYAAEQQDDGTA